MINDGTGQRVAGALFQCGSPAQCLLLAHLVKREDFYHPRLTFGQGAGFIKHQGVELACLLQGIGITYQHAKFGGAAHSGDDRHRRRQTQCARAGDDQDRGGDHQRINQLRLRAKEIPDCGAEQGDGHYRRDEYCRNAIRQLTDLRLTALRLTHQLDDACQGGFAADSAGTE
ncbi:hypothetical protein D3C80_790410 [compost metagenome]